MKHLYTLLIAFLYMNVSNAQNVGIGTPTPDASAVLDASSTTKGFLPPRLTIVQRNAITNPAVGLIIYCIDCDELELFNGFLWKTMSGTAACVSSTLPFIKICDQFWMPKNLDVNKYRNGDVVPQVTDPSVWASLTIGAWCWYNNDSATYAFTYGKLYNWYAVNDSRGLAPLGWHIPSDVEWSTLSTCLGGDGNAGGKMKETGTTHWSSPNLWATNSSGFAGVPAGVRWFTGTFALIATDAYFWSATVNNASSSWFRNLNYNQGNFTRWYYDKPFGFSVRCVRD